MGIAKPAPKAEILTANFVKFADEYRGEPFDFIHYDGPYGIGQDTFNQTSKVHDRYGDSPEASEAPFAALLRNLDPCSASGSRRSDRGILASNARSANERGHRPMIAWGQKAKNLPRAAFAAYRDRQTI